MKFRLRSMVQGMKSNKKSVVYCRVSSQAQLRKGDGLASQETRCREYAKHKGYSVEEVFYDEGISGKLLDRAKMRELLQFLKKTRKMSLLLLSSMTSAVWHEI